MNTKSLLTALGVVLISSSLIGQTLFFDDFDSYADQAAMNAVWTLAPNALTLSGDQAYSPGQSAFAPGNTTAYMMTHDVAPVWGTDANPLVWSFQFYDSTQANNLRQFATIRDNAPALAQIVAIGTYNDTSLTKDRHDLDYQVTIADLNTYYAVRVAFSPGPNWLILNGPGAPTRSTGWHELKAVFYDTTVEFYIDGVNALSDITLSYASDVGAISFDRLTIGSGLSSANGAAYYDDVSLSIIPEPSSMVLGLMGGIGCLLALQNRRK